ncbi:MAG: MBL fold metallo-hydrolase [Bacillota bacterium]
MNIKILGSSSSGNCYILYTSREVLLLECGVQYKKILAGLNYKLDNIVGCLVSHEHKDHSKSIKEIMKAGIDVYTSAGTFQATKASGHRAHVIKSLEQIEIGGFTILPFQTQHDAAEPLGFLIYHEEIGKVLFATDTYYIQYRFPGLNYIMVECNFSNDILQKNLDAGVLNKALKNRLLKSHFSLENVKKFLQANDLSKVEYIFLMHLSSGNSDSELFKTEIQKLTGIPVHIC